jgi:hypothetical protein
LDGHGASELIQAVIGFNMQGMLENPEMAMDESFWVARDQHPINELEIAPIYALLSDFFEKALDSNANPDYLKGVDLAYCCPTGQLYLQQLHLLSSLSSMPPEISSRVLLRWMRTAKPIKLGTNPVGSETWTTPATFELSENIYTGRCGARQGCTMRS